MFAFVTTATVLAFAGGLIVGWTVLPEPEFIRKFWERHGWADR